MNLLIAERPANWQEAIERCTSDHYPKTTRVIKEISCCGRTNRTFGIIAVVSAVLIAISLEFGEDQRSKILGSVIFGGSTLFSIYQVVTNVYDQRQLRKKIAADELDPAHPYLNELLDSDLRRSGLVGTVQA